MLKQETYELWADGFAASIGVAQSLKYNGVDVEDGASPMVYSKFTRQMSGNKKILKAIEDGMYQELQREMYKISMGDKRLVENTIIKRAFDKIYGK